MPFTALTQHRAQLGEGPFWDTPTRALYWVDIAGKQALRLIGQNVQIWQMPEHISAFIPAPAAMRWSRSAAVSIGWISIRPASSHA